MKQSLGSALFALFICLSVVATVAIAADHSVHGSTAIEAHVQPQTGSMVQCTDLYILSPTPVDPNEFEPTVLGDCQNGLFSVRVRNPNTVSITYPGGIAYGKQAQDVQINVTSSKGALVQHSFVDIPSPGQSYCNTSSRLAFGSCSGEHEYDLELSYFLNGTSPYVVRPGYVVYVPLRVDVQSRVVGKWKPNKSKFFGDIFGFNIATTPSTSPDPYEAVITLGTFNETNNILAGYVGYSPYNASATDILKPVAPFETYGSIRNVVFGGEYSKKIITATVDVHHSTNRINVIGGQMRGTFDVLEKIKGKNYIITVEGAHIVDPSNGQSFFIRNAKFVMNL